jgi:hypothetical protein
MGKYLKKKEKKKIKGPLLVLGLILAVLAVLWMLPEEEGMPPMNLPGETEQTASATQAQTETQKQAELKPIVLSDVLTIQFFSDYTGMYMEDGTNEIVSGVMMILLENTSDKDLQLARIDLVYPDFTANFEITNLPAGEKLVALEKNRHSAVTEMPQSAELKNVVFFEEPMSIREESLRISGSNGILEVENISGEDITGDIYVYYKNSATDLLYGGITYRVVIRGGLAAGKTTQMFSGHYSPETSRIVSVVYGE